MAADAGSGVDAADEHRTLAEAIAGMTDSELAELFQRRRDLTRPLPEDLSSLAQRAGSPPSVRLAWLRLTRLQQQVLEVLVAHGRPVDHGELLDAMGSADQTEARRAIDGAVAGCRGAALLWQDRRGLRPVAGLAPLLGAHPCGLDPVDRSDRSRIAGYLADPASLLTELQDAPPGARAALERLLWGPPIGALAHAERPVSAASARTPVEWLLARELLLPAGPDSVVLPREIALLLRGGRYVRAVALPPPAPARHAAAPVMDADAAAGMHALSTTRLANRMLTLLDEGSTRLLRNGGVYQRDAAELARRLTVDTVTAALVADMLLRSGLIAPDEQTGLWGLTRAADSWRTLPEQHQWAALVLAWRDSPSRTTRASDGEAGHRLLSDGLHAPGTAEIRRLCLAEAGRTDPAQPVDAALLAACVAWRQPRLDGTELPTVAGEVLAEGETLGVFGRGVLTRSGRHLAEGFADPAALASSVSWPSLVERLVLQADLTATALGPLTPQSLGRIELLADLESSGAGTVYRFSTRSLQRAFDAGMSTAEVAAELADLSVTGLPSPLETLVGDVGRRHGAVRVAAAASVVTTDDDAALSAALADRSLARLRLHRVAAGVAVSPVGPDEVTAALRQAGVMAVAATPAASRKRRLGTPPPVFRSAPDDEDVHAAVRAVRAGTAAREALAGPAPISRVGPHELVEVLQAAIRDRRSVWLDVTDASGMRRVRAVQPLTLRSGVLSGFDQREHRVLAFPLSRIAGIAVMPQDAGEPATSAPDTRPSG